MPYRHWGFVAIMTMSLFFGLATFFCFACLNFSTFQSNRGQFFRTTPHVYGEQGIHLLLYTSLSGHAKGSCQSVSVIVQYIVMINDQLRASNVVHVDILILNRTELVGLSLQVLYIDKTMFLQSCYAGMICTLLKWVLLTCSDRSTLGSEGCVWVRKEEYLCLQSLSPHGSIQVIIPPSDSELLITL